MYRLVTTSLGQTVVIRDNGNKTYTSFFQDPDNTDYQAYLKFIEEGGVVLPADDEQAA